MADESNHNRDEVLDEAVREFLAAQLRGEEPDLDAFVQQYPGLEERIRRKVRACQRVGSLFDSIRQADESEFPGRGDESDLVGQRLGPFEITEIIGRGGMGIVYKGRDTRLDRTVAIKAMPSHLVEDATARARFKREATLLASLNHTNIGVIYDIIEQDEEGGYLVLEYIPGETLAGRIARGAIQVEEALSIALQIAEAVAVAHERRVIHRDLKPANMMIMPEGKVKVLDFGLARAVAPEVTTAETAVTQPGRVVGTPAYMSPEQARGQVADHRTDIWSLGCVLYEMLTGHLPFEGETATDTLARIIERDPDWDGLPSTTPSSIRTLLRRCLAKDPRRRLQHMGDVALELDETLSLPSDKPSATEPGVTTTSRRRRLLGIVYAAAGFIVGLIVAGIFLSKPARPSPDTIAAIPTHRTAIELAGNQVLGVFHSTLFGVRQPAFALSPDGSRLVYVAQTDDEARLFLRLMNHFEVKPISGTEGASVPFFSPDGQSVGFFAGEKLKVVSLRGGEPMTICDTGFPQTASWGDDGMIYFTGGKDGFSRVPATGGDREPLGTDSNPITGVHPQVLPGSESVLLSSSDGAVHLSLETMEMKLLVEGALYARYVPTGYLVYVRAEVVEAVPFDLATLKVTGPSVVVLEKVLSDSVDGAAQFAFSNNGLLVYVPGGDTARSIPVWVDRQGNVERLPMPVQNYGTLRLSPSQELLAIEVQELRSNVYVYDVATGMANRITLEGNNGSPVWTPDGKRMTFWSDREGRRHSICWKPVDGSGEAESLYSSQHRVSPGSWAPDGKRLALHLIDDGDYGLYVLPLDGPREPEPVLTTDFTEIQVAFSPDGRYMAFTSNKDGDFNVYVCPYPRLDWFTRISRDFGEEPVWSASGDKLFYRNRSKWMVVPISTEPAFKAGTPEVVFEGPYVNVHGLSYDVASDGQRFLVLEPQYDDSEVRELRVVTNWFQELKRLAPSSEAP